MKHWNQSRPFGSLDLQQSQVFEHLQIHIQATVLVYVTRWVIDEDEKQEEEKAYYEERSVQDFGDYDPR